MDAASDPAVTLSTPAAQSTISATMEESALPSIAANQLQAHSPDKELSGEEASAYRAQSLGPDKEALRQEVLPDDTLPDGEDEPDGDGEFLDAEGLPSTGNYLDSGAVPIRAPISDDVEEDEEGEDEEAEVEDEEGSFVSDESYDSAVDRIAASSTADVPSPVGSFTAPVLVGSPADAARTTQQVALMQLNEMNSGISSLDTALLDNPSEDEFKSRVAKIAENQNISPDDEVVQSILDALLPMVRGRVKQINSSEDKAPQDTDGSEGFPRVMPVAKPTAEDDDEDADDMAEGDEEEGDEGHEDSESQTGGIGVGADNGKVEEDKLQLQSAGGLRVRGAEDDIISESDMSEELGTSQPELPIEDRQEEAVGSQKLEAEAQPELPIEDRRDEAVGSQEPEAEVHPEVSIEDSREEAVASQKLEAEEQEDQAREAVEESLIEAGQEKQSVGEILDGTDAPAEASMQELNVGGQPDGIADQVTEVPAEACEGEPLDAGHESVAKVERVTESASGTGLERSLGSEDVSGGAGSTEEEANLSSKDVAHPSLQSQEDGTQPHDSGDKNEDGDLGLATQMGSDASERLEQDHNEVSGTSFVRSMEQETKPSLSSSIVDEGEDEGKCEKVEEPAFDTELAVTLKESGVAVESEGKTNPETESKLVSPEESSLVEDLVEKEKEETGDSEEEGEDDEDGEEETLVENSPRLAAFVHSKVSPAPGADTPSLGGAGPSLPVRPAGLGRSIPPLEHTSRVVQNPRSSGVAAPQPSGPSEDNQVNSDVSEGNEEAREKLQMIRVKFLRLAHRLGQSAHNVVVAQVLYRLGLAEQLRGGRSTSRTGAFSFERASILAEEQEAAGQEELDFGCTIMVLGKTGVGKSATINSIFDEVKSGTDAYSPSTKRVQEITGTVHGIKVRVIDTPGLLPSFADQRHNEKVMSSVKRFIKKSPPDIVLYFDRLDMQSRDYGDLPLLRTITDTFGAAVWFNAIVVLTHASSAPPDGANGTPLSYEMFVAQRSHVVQQTIRQAAGDMRLMNPVSLVENHVACRTNRAGQRVLPNGQVWKPQLLLLCFASKILAEANSLLKLQDSSPGKPFGVRPRVPPLPFLLSSLLQSRAQLKLPDEQMGDEDESDEESEEDSDLDDEEEYDELPPFRRLTKDELGMLDAEQRKAYFEELDYREKLYLKQQWKEERNRRKEMRKRMAAGSRGELQSVDESLEEENAGSAAVPVPMPDMALPPSFDSDNPSHRYRYLDTSSQWLVRPVLETHGWDHDSGYDGLNIEKMFVISKKIPASVSGQITKDKKEANLQMECAASFKSGEGKVTLTGLDIQTIGKDLAYTLRSESQFSNFRRNKTTGGVAVTFLGDTVAAGMKLEDRLMIGRRVKLVLNGGAITGRGDVAYGGSLEATLRDKDYPIGHTLSTLGLSIMDWHGDLAIGGNLQSQFMLGKTMMVARANLNNRGAGQISIRASSSEQLQMALIGIIPLLRTLIGNRLFSSSQP